MAKRSQNLASMPIEALLKLRNDIGLALSKRVGELQRQLGRLTSFRADDRKSSPARKGHALKGRKVAPKYRGPGGETWAGRGVRPRWLTAALNDGAKLEDFAIAGGAGSRRKSPTKRSARKAK
jgi:DNA-binding protein H-NS